MNSIIHSLVAGGGRCSFRSACDAYVSERVESARPDYSARVSAMHLPQFWRIAPAIAFTTPFSPLLRLLTRSPHCTCALFRTARCLFKHTTSLGVNGYFTDNTGHMFAFKLPCKSAGTVQLPRHYLGKLYCTRFAI